MPTGTNRIPNSNGVSTVLDILSHSFSVLQKARPLSSSPHTVTSVITPKSGPSITSTALIATGVFAGIVVVSLIIAKIIAYFTPKSPPIDLTKRNVEVLTTSTAGDNSTKTSPTSLPQTTVSTTANPTPPSSAPTNGSTSLPSSQTQDTPGSNPPETSTQTSSPSISSSPPQTTVTAAANSTLPPSAPTNVSASTHPPQTPDAPSSNPPTTSTPSSSTSISSSPSSTAMSVAANSTLPPSAPINSLAPLSSLSASDKTNNLSPAPSSTANSSSPPNSSNGRQSFYTGINLDESDESDSDDSDQYEEVLPSSSSPTPTPPSVPTNGSAPIPSSSAVSSISSSVSPQQAPSAMQKTVATITNYFTDARHFSKWTKYRLIQNQLEEFARNRNVQPYQPTNNDTATDREIADSWNNLVKALLQPTQYTTADAQYRDTVKWLRNTYQKLVSADATVQNKFNGQLIFVRGLAYVRFAGIELFPYCRELVELASKTPLPAELTLENFLQEFIRLRTALNNPDASHAMNSLACEYNKFRGTTGIGFDPLLKTSNIPYQDGEICINGRKTVMLWHGTPVSQHDPLGLAFDLVAGALTLIPMLSKYVTKGNPVSSPPVVNADHIAFIEDAAAHGKRIYHVMLENGSKKRVADESPRAKVRLQLGIRHPNVFVMALRLDGEFFERHDLHEKTESVQSLKKRLSEQLLMPLPQAEDLSASTATDLTASKLSNIQMEDQLAANGFYVPQKLRDESKLPEYMDQLLDEVHAIYFPDVSNIENLEQHQAFLTLSYVHIMLFITIECQIDIIEAPCKDDKDRGNFIKLIFKLHTLYLTGKISRDTLMFVLVHALARPFILQKNGIIKSRLVLMERVIPIINAAHKKNPNPQTFLTTQEANKTAYYRVAQPEGQTIYPSNNASKTVEEYLAFVEYHKPAPTSCSISIEELSRFGYKNGTRQDALIQQTISAAARSMNISVEKVLIKAPTGKQEAAHNDLLPHLALNYEITGDEAWKISCLFQPALGHALEEPLSKIYNNQLLGISINLDENSLNTHGYGMTLTNQNKKPAITFNGIYNITDRTKAIIARVKVTMTMTDARTGQAQFTCVKI